MCHRAAPTSRVRRADVEVDPVYEDELPESPAPAPFSNAHLIQQHIHTLEQNLLVYHVVSQQGAASPPIVSLHQNVQSRLVAIACVLDMIADYVPVPLHLRLAAGTAYTLMRRGGLLLHHGLVCVHAECILDVYVLHDFVYKRLPQFAAKVPTWQAAAEDDEVDSLDSLGDVDLVDVHDVVQAALLWISRTLELELSLFDQVQAVHAQLQSLHQFQPLTGIPEPCFEPLNHACVPLYTRGVVVE